MLSFFHSNRNSYCFGLLFRHRPLHPFSGICPFGDPNTEIKTLNRFERRLPLDPALFFSLLKVSPVHFPVLFSQVKNIHENHSRCEFRFARKTFVAFEKIKTFILQFSGFFTSIAFFLFRVGVLKLRRISRDNNAQVVL